MAWPNPFYKWTENTRRCWGYTFELGPDHLTPEIAEPLKYSYDTLAEECLDILNDLFPIENLQQVSEVDAKISADGTKQEIPVPNQEAPKPDSEPQHETPKPKPKRDLYILLRDNHTAHPKLQQLWDEVNNIPEWVDWDQISRGQDVFYRYGGATLIGLAYQSLLGGMGANRVVEVLARTGGFGVKVARHRLFETTQHLLQVTRSLESVRPGGDGFASSIRVRLLHAAVRQRILKLTQTRPSYYSVEKFGVPINDLDSMGTIASFSGTMLWLSLPRQFIFVRPQEADDYIALWRLVAHYMGTPTGCFSSAARAKALTESLMLTEIQPSQLSRTLADNLIRCFENSPPAYTSRAFSEVNVRWLNGHELSDALDIGRPSFYYYLLMAGQCFFFMSICYVHRSFDYLDRKQIAAVKRATWQLIVEGKYGLGSVSVFDFKYVPQFDTVTYTGAVDGPEGNVVRVTERRNLKALLVGFTVLGLASWVGIKATIGMTRMVLGVGRFGAGLVHSIVVQS